MRMGMPWVSACHARAQERHDGKDYGAEQRQKEVAETHVCKNLTMLRGNSRAGRRWFVAHRVGASDAEARNTGQ